MRHLAILLVCVAACSPSDEAACPQLDSGAVADAEAEAGSETDAGAGFGSEAGSETETEAETGSEADSAAEPMNVMSYNVRYFTTADGVHQWPNRSDQVASMIRFHGVDLLGTQEVLYIQLLDLEQLLPEYGWFGVGRDDGDKLGEFSAIWYRRDRYEVVEGGTFWLSETPETVGSVGWDAHIPRVCTWARLRDLGTDQTFVHFNTHFDHQGSTARAESAKLVVERIASLAGADPVVLTGDFNFGPSSGGYATLAEALEDAMERSETPHHGPTGTFAGFTVKADVTKRIDFVFVSEGTRVERHGHLSEAWREGHPSDHLPVLTTLTFSPAR